HIHTAAKAVVTICSIRENPTAGLPVILPVLITEARTFLTKTGEKMAFLKLEDKTGSIEAVAFPRLYKEHGASLTLGSCVLIKATISNRNGETSLALENVKPL
ncbi:OB-fold nucleic acid binding domain-containing protein, partial [Candidatus Parcubacteria bacterium]|nr:OB-fold nucleic acid binding domain-containing protein [Candidatus Parcubacteria bacterium]